MNELTTAHAPVNRITGDDVLAIRNLAEAKINTLEAAKFARKEKRRLLRETLRADEEYSALEQQIKDAQKKLKEVKNKLMQRPELVKLESEINDLNETYKTAKRDVSDYLVIYADKTGQLSFIHKNGDEIQIMRQAKIRIVAKQKIIQRRE